MVMFVIYLLKCILTFCHMSIQKDVLLCVLLRQIAKMSISMTLTVVLLVARLGLVSGGTIFL